MVKSNGYDNADSGIATVPEHLFNQITDFH
jgi:hypothetical protein